MFDTVTPTADSSLTERISTPVRNSAFSTTLPTLQLAWDSTSYGAFDKCPRFYQYSIIEGRTSPFINAHLTFGTLFHSATELYAKERAEGLDHNASLLSAIRHAVVETWDSSLNRPWTSEEPTKTRDTLLRSIVWYLDQFQNDSLKTVILANGKPAVELSFRFDSGVETLGDYETCQDCQDALSQVEKNRVCSTCLGTQKVPAKFLLCGHLDRLVEWNGQLWITDKKTTKSELDDNYFKQFSPDSQISIYSIAGVVTLSEEIGGLIIDGAQILVTGSRFRRRPIPTSTDLLEEWMRDFQIRLREAESYAQDNYWPMNRKSCGFGRFQCQFRPVCSAEPSIRETLLETLYSRRVWDPLVPR